MKLNQAKELDATKLRVDQLEGQIKILENQYNLLSKGASSNVTVQVIIETKEDVLMLPKDTWLD